MTTEEIELEGNRLITEYNRTKVKLIHKVTGMTLVPEDIVNSSNYTIKSIREIAAEFCLLDGLSGDNCILCIVAMEDVFDINTDRCYRCPLYLQTDVKCRDTESDYRKIEDRWDENSTDINKEELYGIGDKLLQGLIKLLNK